MQLHRVGRTDFDASNQLTAICGAAADRCTLLKGPPKHALLFKKILPKSKIARRYITSNVAVRIQTELGDSCGESCLQVAPHTGFYSNAGAEKLFALHGLKLLGSSQFTG